MDSSRGYRLKVETVTELSTFVDDFRTSSLRLLSRKYGALVAKASVAIVDNANIGIREFPNDPILEACEQIKSDLKLTQSPYKFPTLNCVIKISFVHDAVLATFIHGNAEYLKTWEGMRPVVKWPWHPKMIKPTNLSDKAWQIRKKYWEACSSKSGFGSGFEVILIEKDLPKLSWGNIRRYIPSFEERVEMAINALRASDKSRLTDKIKYANIRAKVTADIDQDLSKSSFVKQESVPNLQRLREATKLPEESKNLKTLETPAENISSSIDHADIIIASDLRVFIAAPYVGLEADARLFVQVGDSHISFSQNGIQYGYVDSVKKTALDVLKACKTVTVVEVEKINGERLLRAKHIAIVSDVSLNEGLNLSLSRFRKTRISIGEKELVEWDRK